MAFYDSAAEFIKQFEGYIPKARWDVNAFRLGHGSDTITLSNGTYRKVEAGDITTRELAAKDLARRLKGFENIVIKQMGSSSYNNLPDPAKIALISIAYNYGSITKPEIIKAAQSGDVEKLAAAIVESTKDDNKGKSYYETLRKRREEEANYAKSIIKKTVELTKEGIKMTMENPITSAVLAFGMTLGIFILYKTIKKNEK